MHPARASQIVPLSVGDDHEGQHVGVLNLARQLHDLLFGVITIRSERYEALLQNGSDVRAGNESLNEAPALPSQLAPELDEDLFAALRGLCEGLCPASMPMKGALIVKVGV